MADNTTLNPGIGGNVVADEDIGGVHFSKVKIVLGAHGVDGGDVDGANPLPITGAVLAQVGGFAADGAAPVGNPVWIAGWDGVSVRALDVDVTGRAATRILSWFGSAAPTVGQKPMASSLPVTLPSDQATNSNPLIVSPTVYASTAFGQVRVAAPYTLFDGITKYNIDPLEFGTSLTGGGTVTHVPTESAARLAVTAANGDRARLRTHTFHRYQAGKSIHIKQTCYHADTGRANQNRFWGWYDDNDGLFWELTGTTMNVGRRSSVSGAPVDVLVAQAAWNYDPMNGLGPSGVTLDVTKGNIYEIEAQWLGVGVVHFFVNGFLVHTFQIPNTIAGPYMRTAVLPLQWEIVNTAASTGSSFTEICSSVVVEGGDAPPEYGFTAFNAAAINLNAERPILSIRPTTVFPALSAIVNRMLLLPKLLIVSCEAGRCGFRVVLNGTLGGPTAWNPISADSGAEFDVASTTLVGGETVGRSFLANTNDVGQLPLTQFFSLLARKLRRNAFNTGVDVLTITGVSEAAGAVDMRASLTWGEVR